MHRLWAPWRASYLNHIDSHQSSTAKGCIFCDLPAEGPACFKKNLILTSNDLAFVILNRYPYNAGHLMVIPRSHVADLSQLPLNEYRAVCDLLRETLTMLNNEFHPEGFNVGMNLGKAAGAGVADHCHFHIVPRWNGDTNFMPVLSDTKVISESMEAVYDRLYSHLHK